jgi:hypothetical protein
MTNRHDERFIAACAAMEGLIAAPIMPNVVFHTPEELCVQAVKCADALLAELDKTSMPVAPEEDRELEEFAEESEIVDPVTGGI